MTPEQWQRLQALFDGALERPPAQRAAWLDAACDDPDLRAEVEAMLGADDAPPSLLALDPARLLDGGAPDDAPAEGHRIGPYRLVGELGRGGMGTVYLAEREDVQKRVALKLVRGGLAAPDAARRFLVERRVLARLEHPGIARLLDAGVTDEGAPFFAMEVVKGEPITAYAARRALSVDDRLGLFLQACDAVAYAHGRLVVHRDLKPANILVTPDGGVKLLDFGIAKLIEDDDTEGLTRTGARLMTPAYAAPEQIRGEAVTTATDIYALGVILYELLAGRRPHERPDLAPWEQERLILEADPARLPDVATPGAAEAAGTTPEKLRRRLAGDLDTIARKALEKEPARRYPSVQALADDLRRHLDGQPVLARPQTAAYRLRKFARRNRAGVLTAAAVLASVATLVAFFTLRLRDERDRAREAAARAALEAETADQEAGFLAGLFDASNPNAVLPERADTMSARTLLERGARRVETELEDQPEVQARLLVSIAHVYTNLSLYDEAERLLERALAVERGALDPRDPVRGATLEQLARVRREAGDAEGSEGLYRQALALLRALPEGESEPYTATLNGLATTLRELGRYAEAEATYREALAHRRRLAAACRAPSETCRRLRDGVAENLDNLGNALRDLNRLPEAEAAYREALALHVRLLGDDHPDVGTAQNNLAGVLRARGRLQEAEALYRTALARERARLGRHPSVATLLHNLGTTLSDGGRYGEAVALRREAIAIAGEVQGAEHPILAAYTAGLAGDLRALGRLGEAEALARDALRLTQSVQGDDHPETARRRVVLARVLLDRGRAADAEQLLRPAHALLAEGLSPTHLHTAGAATWLGTALARQGRYAEAEPMLLQAHEALQDTGGSEAAATREARAQLAALYRAWGRTDQAARWR